MIHIHDAIDIANSYIDCHKIICTSCNLNYNISDAMILYHRCIYNKYQITYTCTNHKCRKTYIIYISQDGKILKQYNSYEKLCIII